MPRAGIQVCFTQANNYPSLLSLLLNPGILQMMQIVLLVDQPIGHALLGLSIKIGFCVMGSQLQKILYEISNL